MIIRSLILFFTFVFVSPANLVFAGQNSPLVRIAVAKDIDQLTIRMSGAYEIANPLSYEILQKGLGFGPVRIIKGARGLLVGEAEFFQNRLRFSGVRDVVIAVKGVERRYRGYVDVLSMPDGRLLVINQLDVEDYIKGVLYHEVSNRWPMEALKAQAVAARSYAYTQMQANMKKDFDVTNDIYSQVYGGRNSERYRTNLAVDATKGEILTFSGKVLPAYFHATCGGHTEDSAELWPKQKWEPLKGVRCPHCRESPHYFWKRNVRLKDIQDKLLAKGHKIGLIEDIGVSKRDNSERILSVVITDRMGQQITLSGKDFREVVGPNLIRSNNYFVVMKGYYCDFIGKGWGHGVGMCQWGARGMSLKGFAYDQILEFYYPGTEIKVVKYSDPAKAL